MYQFVSHWKVFVFDFKYNDLTSYYPCLMQNLDKKSVTDIVLCKVCFPRYKYDYSFLLWFPIYMSPKMSPEKMVEFDVICILIT